MSSPSQKPSQFYYLPLLSAIMIIGGIQIGFLFYERLHGGKSLLHAGNSNRNTLEEMMNYIDQRYVDEVNTPEIVKTVIDETLSRLDPHSVYIPAEDLADANESLQGNFDGIGIEFSIINDTITVVSPIPDGPAAVQGILPGDKIVKVNDSLFVGEKVNNQSVIGKLKGEQGTKVQVSVFREGTPDLLDFTITRQQIPIQSVDAAYMLNAETGFINIVSFSATTHKEFFQAIKDLKAQGMKKLILDLRQNAGGFLTEATEIADEFIAGRRLLVYTKSHEDESTEEYMSSVKEGEFETGDVVVLIDQFSASASEIVAGALQDWDRALIVGRRSFGKGLVQEQFPLSNGGVLQLTVARYFTPAGRCIQKPYMEDINAYDHELIERYVHGEMFYSDSIAINDTTTYLSNNGRKLYGGGGITPDVFVALDSTLLSAEMYSFRAIIPSFCYTYFSEIRPQMLSYETMQEFDEDFSFSDDLFEKMQTFAQKQDLKLNKKTFLNNKSYITQELKAQLARQIWRGNGFYYFNNKQDRDVQKALELISANMALLLHSDKEKEAN
ncbi:MAG: S41 family peptidase [Chitinophagales bacterium]|nr:S41 family peptidase [Bacteroidota bacterium]MCB9044258.1 S41 family peptidase [Chitinophagales bacterium]